MASYTATVSYMLLITRLLKRHLATRLRNRRLNLLGLLLAYVLLQHLRQFLHKLLGLIKIKKLAAKARTERLMNLGQICKNICSKRSSHEHRMKINVPLLSSIHHSYLAFLGSAHPSL